MPWQRHAFWGCSWSALRRATVVLLIALGVYTIWGFLCFGSAVRWETNPPSYAVAAYRWPASPFWRVHRPLEPFLERVLGWYSSERNNRISAEFETIVSRFHFALDRKLFGDHRPPEFGGRTSHAGVLNDFQVQSIWESAAGMHVSERFGWPHYLGHTNRMALEFAAAMELRHLLRDAPCRHPEARDLVDAFESKQYAYYVTYSTAAADGMAALLMELARRGHVPPKSGP